MRNLYIQTQIRKLSQKSTTRFNNSDSIVCLANYNEEYNQTPVVIEIYNRSTVYLARSKRRCASSSKNVSFRLKKTSEN